MRPVRSLFAVAAAALSIVGGACADKPASTVVVALSSEAAIPDGVRSINIKVTRGGNVYHDATYHVLGTKATDPSVDPTKVLSIEDIPGTLTLNDDEQASGPVSVRVSADVVTEGGVTRTAVRSATMPFVAEKQKLLRMPIQLSCANAGCKEGESCRAGQCITDDTVSESELEDFEESKARPAAGACFQRTECGLKNEIRLSVDTVLSVLDDSTCTVPYVLPGVPADDELAKLDATARKERVEALRKQINMGYIWSGRYNVRNAGSSTKAIDHTNGEWTVVDHDPREGWEFADQHPSTSTKAGQEERVVLAPGLCAALIADRKALEQARAEEKKTGVYKRPQTNVLGTVEQRGCIPKPPNVPECKVGQAGVDGAREGTPKAP